MSEDERLHGGGLMRCCSSSWAEQVSADVEWHDGDRIQCKYAPDDEWHRMVRVDGTWEWDRTDDR